MVTTQKTAFVIVYLEHDGPAFKVLRAYRKKEAAELDVKLMQDVNSPGGLEIHEVPIL